MDISCPTLEGLVEVRHDHQVKALRDLAKAKAEEYGCDTDEARYVASELGGNAVRHGAGGTCYLDARSGDLQIWAVNRAERQAAPPLVRVVMDTIHDVRVATLDTPRRAAVRSQPIKFIPFSSTAGRELERIGDRVATTVAHHGLAAGDVAPLCAAAEELARYAPEDGERCVDVEVHDTCLVIVVLFDLASPTAQPLPDAPDDAEGGRGLGLTMALSKRVEHGWYATRDLSRD